MQNDKQNYFNDALSESMVQSCFSYQNFNEEVNTYQLKKCRYKLFERNDMDKIKLCEESNFNKLVLGVSILNIVLSKYTSSNTNIMDATINGKDLYQLITDLGDKCTFEEIFNEVNKNAKKVLCNEKFIKPKDDDSKTDILVYFNNNLESIDMSNYNYNIVFVFEEMDDDVYVAIHYNSALYSEIYINNLYNHMINTFNCIKEDMSISISEIQILSLEEKNKIIFEFNNSKESYEYDKTIKQLFEEQVEKTPKNIALVYKDRYLTYEELNEKANSLARFLRDNKVKEESIVAIMGDKSFETIIGMLAILKAGAAYMPIDPDYPKDRIEYMLLDSESKIILVQGDEEKTIDFEFSGKVINLNDEDIYIYDDTNLSDINTVDNLSYIIYTSGTTGKPKGVMLNNRGISNLKSIFERSLKINDKDKIIQFASFSFDASVWEISMALLNGAELHLLERKVVSDYELFENYLNDQEITVATLPPVYLNNLNSEKVNKLRILMTAGSVIDKNLLSKWSDKVQYINAYGPTETTICATMWKFDKNVDNLSKVPIGKPLSNLDAYIVNKNNELLPIGVTGELCISGCRLARGYINREDLTNKSFINNPFKENSKMYKTGDYARWLPDGNIEYLGRIDKQVKIRGFRIELGEIQNVLNSCSGVKDSVVLDRKDESGDTKLAAYIVFDDTNTQSDGKENVYMEEYKELFEEVYVDEYLEEDSGFNTVGWKSSYTGKDLSSEELNEFYKNAIDRIGLLNPRKVLEIGCGSGSILLGTAPKCEKYYATDISSKAIEYIQKTINDNEEINNKVTLYNSVNTDDFVNLEEKFDTIIMNSVIQYFPNVNHLMFVIKQAISKIENKGVIFIGDVRNYTLLNEFNSAVNIYQSSAEDSISKLKNRINIDKRNTGELTVDPMFFYALKEYLPEVKYVEVRYKRGKSSNELSQFRYDALLYINTEVNEKMFKENSKEVTWNSDNLNLSNISEILEKEDLNVLTVKDIPNKRLSKILKQDELLYSRDDLETVKDLNDAVELEMNNNEVELEEFFKLGTDKYIAEVEWSGEGKNAYYNIVYLNKNNCNTNDYYCVFPSFVDKDSIDLNFGKYGNNPLKDKREKELIPKIKSYLRSKLPDYMMPSYYIKVDEMPLTINGKVDVKKLFEIGTENIIQEQYEAPTTITERKLEKLWEEILFIEDIGINDNFFDIGGHSLKASNLTAKMKKEFRVNLSVKSIFDNPTIKLLSKLIENSDKNEYVDIIKAEEKEYYEVSSAEKRIYTLCKMDKENLEYNIPLMIKINRKIDKEELKDALNLITSRHEILRTSFLMIDDKVVQKVNDKWELDFEYKEMAEDNLDEEIKSFIKPFDLSKYPLFRSELIKLEEEKYVLIIDFLHIIVDGISNVIIMNEIKNILSGKELEEVEYQYKDYSEWQNSDEEKARVKEEEKYWLNRFEGELPVLNLFTDYERPKVRSTNGDKIQFKLNNNIVEKVREMAKKTGTTLYMVYLSAFYILLSKYTSQEDIIVGTAEAGRSRVEFENVVGMFVNTIALRNYPKKDEKYIDFLQEVKKNVMKDFENKEYQFDDLVQALGIRKEANRNPLFDAMFVVENVNSIGDDEPIELKSNSTKFDLTLIIYESNNEVNIEYNVDLFKKDTIERMLENYVNILNKIVDNQNIKLCDIDILGEEEKDKLLNKFNDTAEDYPIDKTVQELFQKQVNETPDNIAIVCDDKKLTYKELNEKANSLARVLREKGVGSESIVGIMVDRTVNMFIGIMGILKAGGAYVPIDPEYPEERIEYMLSDSNSKLLLTETSLINKVKYDNVINLDEENLYEGNKTDLDIINNSSNLAYVIYTSGTTGNPKGVMIEHR